MQNRTAKVFIIVFFVLISIPLVFVILRIKIDPINKMEKKIGLNFKRNFPLRADLFKIYSFVKTTCFQSDPIPNSVIDAKNGWKFLGNKYSNALSESKGHIVFSKKEISKLKENILSKKKWLEKKNINFYISVPPNKHSIYGDMIPIRKSNRKTKSEQLDSICKSIGVKYIDLGAKFPENDSLWLYHKTDSHWNHLAGFYAFKSTIETISNDFKNVKFNFHTLNDMDIVFFKSEICDLNRSLFLEQNEQFINVKNKKPFDFLLQEKRLVPPSDFYFADQYYEERYKSDINKLKILVLRDSFFGAYSELIADNFGESLFIWWHNFNKELIDLEKPNIVCYEIVERNLDILLDENFIHSPN